MMMMMLYSGYVSSLTVKAHAMVTTTRKKKSGGCRALLRRRVVRRTQTCDSGLKGRTPAGRCCCSKEVEEFEA